MISQYKKLNQFFQLLRSLIVDNTYKLIINVIDFNIEKNKTYFL